MKIKNIKQYKSSLLGLVFIGTGIYLLTNNITSDYYILGGLFVSGVLLLLAPDDYINILEEVIRNYFKKNP